MKTVAGFILLANKVPDTEHWSLLRERVAAPLPCMLPLPTLQRG